MKPLPIIDHRLRRLLAIAAVSVGFALYSVTAVYAADDDDLNGDTESYFQNPAQAAHAANLAEEKATSEMSEALQDAWADYQAAIGTEEEAAKEKAYLDQLAEDVGLLSDDIADMRDEGMGWGEIAHDLGVHPSVIGLGHKFKMKEKNRNANAAMFGDEISEATARNTRTGNAKGHGLGLGAASGPSGKGLGLGKNKEGKVGGAAGLGVGRGKSGAAGGPGNSNAGGLGGSKSNNAGGLGGSKSNNAGGLGGSKGNNAGGLGGGKGNSNAGGNGKGNAGGNGKGGGKK